MMGIPILIVHWGNPDYLKYTISQAKYFNPDSDIILLDDNLQSKYKNYTHYHLSEFSSQASILDSIYVHLNTVIPKWAVINWMKRWFIMKEFAEKNISGGQFICIDSDVLLYCNVTEEAKKYKEYKLTVANECGLGNNYFQNYSALKELTDLIKLLYTDKDYFSSLSRKYEYNVTNNIPGGIDDNHMFNEYRTRNPSFVGNTATIFNGTTYDSNIYLQEGFEFDEKLRIKKVYWKNDLPYGRLLSSGELIKFNTLHFQGSAKKLMHKYYRGASMPLDYLKSELYYNYYLPAKTLARNIIKKST